jgi:DNA-binding NarL/FixJ family response regulator
LKNEVESQMSEQVNVAIRVLIVSDHVLLRQGLRAMLQEEDFEIVGETGTVKAASVLTKELQPDIVLLDTSLETSSGLVAVKQLLLSSPTYLGMVRATG